MKERGSASSVKDLIVLLARSFQALVPVFEDAHLTWRDGEAYDQWDTVSEELFFVLVAEPWHGPSVSPAAFGWAGTTFRLKS